MNDKELLELAAKAAGMSVDWWDERGSFLDKATIEMWNPLIDDGDALRLAVKLRITISYLGKAADCFTVSKDTEKPWPQHIQPWGRDAGDDTAATRRAIVRAAATVGA